jgi:hypothetical protein
LLSSETTRSYIMNVKLISSALVAVSLLGSTIAASAQAGGAEGVGAATVPGSDVRAGERHMNAEPNVTTGSAATRSREIQDESQYTIGDKKGRGPGEKPGGEEVAPAGR